MDYQPPLLFHFLGYQISIYMFQAEKTVTIDLAKLRRLPARCAEENLFVLRGAAPLTASAPTGPN